jgi:hypothetical protein
MLWKRMAQFLQLEKKRASFTGQAEKEVDLVVNDGKKTSN